jgi:hypothetical protein
MKKTASPTTAGNSYRSEGQDRPESGSTIRPTRDQIAEEAYRIDLDNGAKDGRDLEDWLEAERRLSAVADFARDLNEARTPAPQAGQFSQPDGDRAADRFERLGA